MKKPVLSILIVLIPALLYSQISWKLPGTDPVSHYGKYPRLINYAFRTDELIKSNNNSTYQLEERLSQWDIIIVHPDSGYSYSKVRENNPNIIILAWIPVHGPGEWEDLHKGYKPEWNCIDGSGDTIIASWGQPIANLFTDSMGYAKHIFSFLAQRQASFDGVYLDCLWETNWFNADINLDGLVNNADRDSMRSAQLYLLDKIEEINPAWLVIGNNTIPWSDNCVLYDYTDGTIHINALGNQYADSSWNFIWTTYNRINERETDTFIHIINADVRCNRSYEQASAITDLTENDKRRFRVGLAGSMLIDNTFFAFDKGDGLHGQLWWFDEYDVDIGNPLDSYESNIYGESTLSREFENGTVILNQGSIPVYISFDEDRTDVSFDNTSSTFELPANDARIYIKQKPEPLTYYEWEIPPSTYRDNNKKTPRLVNYAHRYDKLMTTNGTYKLEERLAQWDVIILNPDYNLVNKNFSHDKIREINPDIKILAWIPMQGPGTWDSLIHGFNEDWYLKTTTGEFFEPWGFPLANPFIDNYGYSRHMLNFIENKVQQDVDGIMFDCLFDGGWSGADYNEDGVVDDSDRDSLRSSEIFLLNELRRLHPDWILTGNGGVPWSQDCELYDYANGNMHENALGNEWADPGWQYTWDAYSNLGGLAREPVYHFINADVRMNRTLEEATVIDKLTGDDMRRFRLGLVITVLRNYGYFGFDRGDCLHGQLWWFKEYDVDLGAPLGDYETGTYGNEILSREFENATVILNPTGSDIEVTFEEKHTDVSFDIDSTVFTVPANDARIFEVYKEIIDNIASPIIKNDNIKELKIFPNPAYSFIKLCFELSNDDFVTIEIINIYGKSVKKINKPFLKAGKYEILEDVSDLKPDIYIIKLNTGSSYVNYYLIIP